MSVAVPGLALGPAGEWLQSVLAGDSTLAGLAPGGVHEGSVPTGGSFPAVVHACAGGTPLYTVDAHEIWDDLDYFIRAEGEGGHSIAALVAIMSRVKVVLQEGAAALPEGEIFSCIYRNTLPVGEDYVAGVAYPKVITRWSIKARAA